jgi:carbamate kinase
MILSNVDGVFTDFGTAQQKKLDRISTAEAERLLQSDELGQGSMAPKVEAALSFVKAGGSQAIIARLDQGLEALHGEAGTIIA